MNLIHPTPAKIKAECLNVLEARFSRKDERMLTAFFGGMNGEDEYRTAIKKIDGDRFKPLTNFLRGNTQATDESNIELLAWLIDFEPRPYRVRKAESPDERSEILISDDHMPMLAAKNLKQKLFNGKQKRQFLSLFVALLALAFIFQHYTKVGFSPLHHPFSGEEQCMYWAGDQYKPVLCNVKIENRPVYALDIEKLEHLRMITKSDTITKKSIGHLWYAKINGKIEFYSASGYHPVYTNKPLKPLTLYMYTKYILSRR